MLIGIERGRVVVVLFVEDQQPKWSFPVLAISASSFARTLLMQTMLFVVHVITADLMDR